MRKWEEIIGCPRFLLLAPSPGYTGNTDDTGNTGSTGNTGNTGNTNNTGDTAPSLSSLHVARNTATFVEQVQPLPLLMQFQDKVKMHTREKKN